MTLFSGDQPLLLVLPVIENLGSSILSLRLDPVLDFSRHSELLVQVGLDILAILPRLQVLASVIRSADLAERPLVSLSLDLRYHVLNLHSMLASTNALQPLEVSMRLFLLTLIQL